MKKLSFVLISLLMLMLLTGCGAKQSSNGSKTGDALTIAFVPKVTGNAFFEAANKGAQAYADEQGFQVEYVGSSVASADNQITILDDLIARKVDAICISSLDATALDDSLLRAKQAGISVVTWDADVSGNARSIMVSQGTPEQLGKMLVEMGAKSLAERGLQPASHPIRYAWHYSQPSVSDQNSWQAAGEAYIQSAYPSWVNVAPDNYYSHQDAEEAIKVGEAILTDHPDIDLIICNDSTALPGQAQAAANLGLGEADVTITGFASPNAMRSFCKEGIIRRWGLWDCQVQGALGCYMAYYLASGNSVNVGDRIDVPQIGIVDVMSNTVLDPSAYTAKDSGVVLLPHRSEYTIENVDDYDF